MRANTLDRNFAESHGGLAVALINLGRIDDGQLSIKLADKLNSTNFGSVYAKSLLLQLNGQRNLADKLIAKALEKHPLKAQ